MLHGRTRPEMVGLFLAMLSLIREQRLAFHQEQDEHGVKGAIVLEARVPPEGEDDDAPAAIVDEYAG